MWKTRDSVLAHSQYQPVIEGESSSLNSKSKNTRLLGEMFNIPLPKERMYQHKNISYVGDTNFKPKGVNHRWGYKNTLNVGPNIFQVSYIKRNHIDLDDPVYIETTSTDPNELLLEIEVLRKKVAKEDAQHIHLEK